MLDGILLVDKPSGWTSFDVVAKVRGVIRQETGQKGSPPGEDSQWGKQKKVKIGHTGTLDPLATGLLVLVVGSYTKRVPEFSKVDKTYEVTMRLGQTSTTGDEEGEKTAVSHVQPSEDAVKAALQSFVGHIEQIPPAYSAIKINGQRAYKLARAGKEVKLEPRPVTIYSIELTRYSYPEVDFTTTVSSGTYIRTLVEDIGQSLSTGAYMSGLRRTGVGSYSIEHALQVEYLSAETIREKLLVDKK